MVIEPAVEVKAVVDAAAAEENGARADAGEKGRADAQIGGGLPSAEAARGDRNTLRDRILIGHSRELAPSNYYSATDNACSDRRGSSFIDPGRLR